MKTIAAVAVSLGLIGQGTAYAAGQPCADPDLAADLASEKAVGEASDVVATKEGAAAPGHEYGTAADVAAKSELDQEKYEENPPNQAMEGCEDAPAEATETK